jgi:branched-chain amino acid aminotransferase
MIAVEPFLGVHPSAHNYFSVSLSPVGAYYAAGFNPVNILVEDHYGPAGGTGEATGGNYASSLKAGLEAKKKGFDQVLWLDGIERRYIEEVGAMNMFFATGNILLPPADRFDSFRRDTGFCSYACPDPWLHD